MQVVYIRSLLTSSKNSGSEAEASHRLLSIKMFGLDSFVETLWKKFFSYLKKKQYYEDNTNKI